MASINNKKCGNYSKIQAQKVGQTKYYSPKSANIVKHAAPVGKKKVKQVILASDGIHDKAPADINKTNDRLVIELADYLALTKNKKIAKFKLKQISSESEELSSLHDICKTANTTVINQMLKDGHLIKNTVKTSNKESQRTFLLVPQKIVEPVKKQSQFFQNKKKSQVVITSETSSLINTFKKLEEINHQNSSIQLSNILKSSQNVAIKIVNPKKQEPVLQLPGKKSRTLIRVPNDIQPDSSNQLTQGKKRVVLKSHPYFSNHKPFIIKHRPAVAKVAEQQHSFALQQEDAESDIVHNILDHNELIEEIKCETSEQDLQFLVPEESEIVSEIFPVEIKPNDADNFEYLEFEDNNELLTESEMQILGI